MPAGAIFFVLGSLTGRSVPRIEDRPVLLGKSNYVGDVKFDNCAYLGIVRSPYAHARVVSIDTTRIAGVSDAVRVFTSKQLSQLVGPARVMVNPPGQKQRVLLPFAADKVRYVGEPVAVVVTNSRNAVEDAIDAVDVEYESLPAVVDAESGMKSEVVINEEWGDNLALHQERKGGKPREAFERAEAAIEARFSMQRYSGTPMEPRAVAASYDPARDYLTVWSSTQWPHMLRSFIASALGINENRIRCIAPDVGGAFGNKEGLYPEELFVPMVSRMIGRPAKWVATRSEDLKTTVHSRDQVHYFKLAGTRDGRITFMGDRIIADIGALDILSTGPPMQTLATFPGPYDIRNLDLSLDCVTTNKTAEGPYRGFGTPEATFAIERGIDLFAEEIKADPADVRMKNLVPAEAFPYTTAMGARYDSGDYQGCLRRAIEISGYWRMKSEESHYQKVMGVGLSFYNEIGSFAPSKFMYDIGSRYYSGWDTTTVRVTKTGKVIVLLGLPTQGQGHETTMAQVCADEFQLDIKEITVLHGDSNTSPFNFGDWGTRSTVACASMVRAARKILKKCSLIAAHMLAVPASEVSYSMGVFRTEDGRTLPLIDVVERAYQGYPLPDGVEPGLEETSNYDPQGLTYSYAASVAVVEVDSGTGEVGLKDFYVVHDSGNVINPAIVEGQMIGAIAQGIGGTMTEEFKYDEEGQLLTSTFADYLIPTALDMPKRLVLEEMRTPSPYNDGFKGMSEGGCIGTPAAIANAVDDAMRKIGGGVVLSTPLEPERIWRLLRASRAAAGIRSLVGAKAE